MPSSAEARGWARLATELADQVVVGAVQGMHQAVSDGGFRWLGPFGVPVKRVHDAVMGRAYGMVRAGLRSLGEVGAAAAGRLATGQSSPTAVKAHAIAHAVVGAAVLPPELDLDVTLRHGGRSVSPGAGDLGDAYPAAGGRIAVFLHGLADSEAAWHAMPRHAVALPEVAADLGITPLLVRYGTGRSIGRSGADLAGLLEDVVAAWPVPVTRLVLIGHSMGGLVARAGCGVGRERGHGWTTALSDVVYIGTPHLGSWLEKLANVTSWALRHSSPYGAPIGTVLDGRSRGVKDLRFGTLAETGWDERPPDGLLSGLVPDDPWFDDVTHHLIVGRLRPAERHPLNVAFGDGLVRSGSAVGVGYRRRISGGRVVVVPVEARHSRLLSHPEVSVLLRRVLASATARG